MVKPACEHYWADHCYDGLSVRLCQLCHEPDWDDLRRQLAEAAAEREACAQLADDLGATYPVTCTMADCPCLPGESAHTRPFADLLRKDPR